MTAFQPEVLSEEEVEQLLTQVTGEEIAQARELSLTPLKEQILFEGVPGTAIVRDSTGKEYIDCTAQAWTLNSGYCNPDILYTVAQQMKHLTHVRYGYPTIPRIKLTNRLSELFPGNLRQVALNNEGGGFALEAAMKLAMINRPGASTFLTAWRGYHGASLATIPASHYMPYLTRFTGYGLEHYVKFPYPYCYRCPVGLERETCSLACLQLVEGAIKYGANTPVAGLIIEPIQGPGGMIPTPDGYLAGVKELCRQYGIYLIYDEAQTTFGRVGAMSAAELYGVAPDMMALTKALGGGFPIGALLVREGLKRFTEAEEHTTFGSNPVMMAAALASIEVVLRKDLAGRAKRLGEQVTARLEELQDKYEIIGDIRGPGLFIGIELVEDRESKEPAFERAIAFLEIAMQLGVIFDVDMPDIAAGLPTRRNVIKIKPVLTITDEQMEQAMQVFEICLQKVSALSDEEKGDIMQKLMAQALPT
ncbi:MAG: aminotransferase class III-fold pyridoxal phosphate-dependent enzyme [Anaerolineae bacterium]|nr:aminotransferase class III-fold pyridoxal phosphate-dependent enzyme [Anaerolineae bacterium]NIQ78178.1 aminotransferase class III-fold pyridoxal phosphate-dependent enzyme [Anaerolineae bacterium]